MAFDPVRESLILFGGVGDSSGRKYQETWELTGGGSWVRLNPPDSPSARTGHGMVTDFARNKILLFGGWSSDYFNPVPRDKDPSQNEVWEWDGAAVTWTNRMSYTVDVAMDVAGGTGGITSTGIDGSVGAAGTGGAAGSVFTLDGSQVDTPFTGGRDGRRVAWEEPVAAEAWSTQVAPAASVSLAQEGISRSPCCSSRDWPCYARAAVGDFGSERSDLSIFNRHSDYGSRFSNYGVCNEHASEPPVVVDGEGHYFGRLTTNRFADQVQDPALVSWLTAVCEHQR